MSVEAISHIMRTHIADGIAKLVAMVLADYAHPTTGECWPKISTLAKQCSQHERTVQKKLKLLQELDVLHIRINKTGNRKGNIYVLHLPGVPREDAGDPPSPTTTARRARGDSRPPVSGTQNSATRRPRGGQSDTRRVAGAPPPKENPPGTPPSESHSDPSGSAPQDGADRKSFRRELLDRGLRTVRDLTGRPEERCRTLIGSWLALVDDDAVTVLRAIDDAGEGEVVGPVAWIEARLKRHKAAAPHVAATSRPAKVFVREDTPAWDAWQSHLRTVQGRGSPVTERAGARGWSFDSEWPPAIEVA